MVARAQMSVALQQNIGNAATTAKLAGPPKKHDAAHKTEPHGSEKHPAAADGAANAAREDAQAPGIDAPAAKEAPAGRAVELKMKEPPAQMSAASRKRLASTGAAAAQKASAAAALPSASAHVGQAKAAVTPPAAESAAHAQADLVTLLGTRPKPSPEIEKLCANIHDIIAGKTPKNEDELVGADPEKMATEAGGELKGNVQGAVQGVSDSYTPLEAKPAGTPGAPGAPLQPPGAAAPTASLDAEHAVPDPIPAKAMSLDADAADMQAKSRDAGMDTDAAKVVQTGPIAEARAAQGELEQTAKEDPAKVAAQQQAALAKAGSDMAALQKAALDALNASRHGTVASTGAQQHKMVGSEESMRAEASARAEAIFTDAQTKVEAQLKPIQDIATKKWDAGIQIATANFKQKLKNVEDYIEERHSGVLGATVVSLADAWGGLPPWILDAYRLAEEVFAKDVCALAREISTEVNGIILVCEALIADARQKITDVFNQLPKGLQSWAAEQQAQFAGKLDTLAKSAHDAQTNFTRDLVKNATQTFQEAHDQVHALREKAKGFVGRIADALEEFAKDPGKFIIEGILSLLNIPAAAFWAVVAKIQKVVGQIAADPMKFAGNLLDAVGKGFTQFFDNISTHLLQGFISWLTGALATAGITLPKDMTIKSIVTFILELMGITWPRIRKLLAKHIGEENVALIEKTYDIVSNLIAMGPEGVFEMIKEKLDPKGIVDQIVSAAVDYMTTAVIKAVSARILLLFNPVGAILQAIEAIYKVLKWIFVNAARIFKLIETIVDGIADIIAGNVGGMANAIESALAQLIPPVIDFLAGYLGFSDLPAKVKETIAKFQDWVEGKLDDVIGWLVEKGKALLASVGIGGQKEGDKGAEAAQVGEPVAFSAGDEQHRLWIAVENGKPTLMLASGAAALFSFLDGDRVSKAVAADSDRPAAQKLGPVVARARKLAGETGIDADKVIAAMKDAGAEKNAISNENTVVKTAEHELADVLALILEAVDKDGLTIFEVLGKAIDPLPADPKPDGYVYAKEHDLKEIRRGSGKAKKGPEQYPRVHVDKDGIIAQGSGIHRYDHALIQRFRDAIAGVDFDADGAPAGAESLINKLDSGADKPEQFNKGIRAQMEQIIADIEGKAGVSGIEVPLGDQKVIDYTLRVEKGGIIENVLVEYKSWTGKNYRKARIITLAASLQKQLTAYVDLARTGGNDYHRLILKWPGFSNLNDASQSAFRNILAIVQLHANSKPAGQRIEFDVRL
ncbi:MAG TPA: hypothetical protein VGC72_11215 [Candidatus Elarobacter sp.]